MRFPLLLVTVYLLLAVSFAQAPRQSSSPVSGEGGIFTEIASQAEAEAGIENTKGMTPLRTQQAIAALGGTSPAGSDGDIQKNNAGAFGVATPGTDYLVSLAGAQGVQCSGADGELTCSVDRAVLSIKSTSSGTPDGVGHLYGDLMVGDTGATPALYVCLADDAADCTSVVKLAKFSDIPTTETRYTTFQTAVCQGTAAGTNFSLRATGAPEPSCVTGTNVNTAGLKFDADTLEAVQTWVRLPAGWTGAIDLAGKWRAAATSGDVVWAVQTICVADAETSDPAFNTANTVTDAAKGTTLQQNDFSSAGITTTGCAANEVMYFRFYRDAANGSDTMTGDAELLSLTLTIRRTI